MRLKASQVRRFFASLHQPQAGCAATRFALLAPLFCLLMVGTASRIFAQSLSGFTYNGVVYTSYQANEYLETPQGPQGTAAIHATGANYTSVVVTQYMQTSTSNVIAPETPSTPGYNSSADPLSPTDDAVVAAIQNLQAQGLTVVLKPQVDSIDGVFRGNFAPSNPTAWFASYQTFILHYAQLASQNNVGNLVIGTELKTLSGSAYVSNWTNIINVIRASYPNLTLIYGANATGAGDEFTTVSFWDKVDIIGVDGYFPLTNHADPTVAQLVAAWSSNKNGFNALAALKNLQSTYNKPLIFSELGYVSAAGTNEAPYSSAAAGATYDPTEQENCYEAFFEVFSQQTSWMKGVFWWAWNVTPPGSTDTGYTPQNKPAATTTLPKWFGSTTPGFTLTAAGNAVALGQGLSAADTISVTNLGGFTGSVTLAASGLPSGVSATFAAGAAPGAQVLTLTATSAATVGVGSVTITGTSGSLTTSTAITLTVQAPTLQTISFSAPATQTSGTTLALSATATSGLPVSFASSTPGVCTVSGSTATFLASGTCTITASQAGNSVYSAAMPVGQSFSVGALAVAPVPVSADVIVSQLNWLDALPGYVQTSNNPAGGSFGVNTVGQIAVADTNNLILINAQTGVSTTLGPWSGASAVAVDSKNNIYVGSLYGSPAVVAKVPYIGGAANGGYAAFATPSTTTPACTSTSTTECTVTRVGSISPSALAFDSAGDMFWITSSSGTANSIYECTVACLAGTGSPVLLYTEPTAATAPSTASGQLLAGGLAIDPTGNIFFTDSSSYVNTATYAYTSFYSRLNELPASTGTGFSGATTGYASAPTVLYTTTPSSIGTYNNELDAVAVNGTTGTVYFADQSNGILAFPNTGGPISVANGQPTALYAISTQGAKTLTIDTQGNLYLAASSTVINSSGGDTIAQVGVNNVIVPSSPVGTAVSPSTTLHAVTTILNDAGCSSNPGPAVTFAAASSASATATANTTGTCVSTVTGGSSFATAVSFTPTAGGTDSVPLTATDQADNTGTVAVTGVGQQTVTAQTITFTNPGTQTVGTPLTLAATASSGLTVTFTSATPTICTVSGNTATFVAVGTCTIHADQAGSAAYSAASEVAQSFTVNAAASFNLVPSAATLSVTQGASATDTITVTGANGFSGSVMLAATGLPAGVTGTFATNPATATSLLTITTASTATPGTATVTVTGTSGSLTASTTFVLTVQAPASFTLAPTAAMLSVTQGASATDTVAVTGANGFSGSVMLAASGLPAGVTATFATNPTTASSGVSFAVSSTAATGPATVTITGTSGTLTASTTITLTVTAPPSFTLSSSVPAVVLSQGGTVTSTVNVKGASGFNGTVMLATAGLPSGVTAAFATNPVTSSSVLMFTATGTATLGNATVTVTGTSGNLSASTTIALTVNVPPSITVAPAATTETVIPGASVTDVIALSSVGGFTGPVVLTAAVTASPQGTQDVPTVSFGSTGMVNLTATAGGSGTLTISTTAATTGALIQPARNPKHLELAGGTALACLLLLGFSQKRRSWPKRLTVLIFMTAITGGMVGCSSNSPSSTTGNSGTTPGNYVVTVTATSGATSATIPINLTVQ